MNNEKNYMIDPNKIHEFRHKINSVNTYDLYKNRQGKNHWHIICSCMDWIDISCEYLNDKLVLNARSRYIGIENY
ncbi:MAG: hypothetical protein ACLFSQ_11480, partial [Candidatus Zixiibacteriota bacterium]